VLHDTLAGIVVALERSPTLLGWCTCAIAFTLTARHAGTIVPHEVRTALAAAHADLLAIAASTTSDVADTSAIVETRAHTTRAAAALARALANALGAEFSAWLNDEAGATRGALAALTHDWLRRLREEQPVSVMRRGVCVRVRDRACCAATRLRSSTSPATHCCQQSLLNMYVCACGVYAFRVCAGR
jgi:hypothetical protein